MATKIDAQSNAVSNLGNGTSSQLVAGDGTAVTLGTNLSMVAGTLNASGGGSWTAYNVPDPTYWEDTGVVAPYAMGGVWRLGSTTYMFGGTNGVIGSKIYSATDNGSGAASTYTFADTGGTIPAAVIGARLFQIGSSLYIVGANSNSKAVWKAATSNPLSWSVLTSLPTIADNAGYFILNGLVTIFSGYNSAVPAGLSSNYTCPVTSMAAPTWTTTSNPFVGGQNSWEGAIYFSGDNLIYIGGTGFPDPGVSQKVYSPYSWPSSYAFTFTGPAWTNTPEVFDLGDSVCFVGMSNTADVYLMQKGTYASPQKVYTLSAVQRYVFGCRWIGRDGRAYFVNVDNRHIFRSGRKVVYTQQTSPYDVSTGLKAIYADGKPTTISAHVLTGNPGWLQSP